MQTQKNNLGDLVGEVDVANDPEGVKNSEEKSNLYCVQE